VHDASLDDEPAHMIVGQPLECILQRQFRPDHDRLHLHASAARGLTDLFHVRLGEGISIVGEHADTVGVGDELAKQLYTLSGHFRTRA
jgi:hypothetical protein